MTTTLDLTEPTTTTTSGLPYWVRFDILRDAKLKAPYEAMQAARRVYEAARNGAADGRVIDWVAVNGEARWEAFATAYSILRTARWHAYPEHDDIARGQRARQQRKDGQQARENADYAADWADRYC